MRMRVLVMRALLLWMIRSRDIAVWVLHWEELAFKGVLGMTIARMANV